ncbi:hypothetical protein FI950_25355 [Salmonella enterica]|nr:hypothetical protein [Salmonella enterica]
MGCVHYILHYSVEDGGEFHTPLRGIPRGSALSPLLAAFHLTETDNVFSRNRHVTYARYMDDFLILSPTRWHLRRAVRMLNRHFAQAGFEQHPDKTFIGRVEKGFDWMGFWFTEKGCDGVAPRALQHFKDRLRRLYGRARQWPEDLRLRPGISQNVVPYPVQDTATETLIKGILRFVRCFKTVIRVSYPPCDIHDLIHRLHNVVGCQICAIRHRTVHYHGSDRRRLRDHEEHLTAVLARCAVNPEYAPAHPLYADGRV